jgi:hypothetical protein
MQIVLKVQRRSEQTSANLLSVQGPVPSGTYRYLLLDIHYTVLVAS